MKLRNKLPHMFGQKVDVGGTVYSIDSNGVIENVTDKNAASLLQNSAWCMVVERKMVERKSVHKNEINDLSKLKKSEVIKLLEYKNIDFDLSMKKSELLSLLEEKDNLNEKV